MLLFPSHKYHVCWGVQQAPKAVKLDVPAPQYSHACNKVTICNTACHRVVKMMLHS